GGGGEGRGAADRADAADGARGSGDRDDAGGAGAELPQGAALRRLLLVRRLLDPPQREEQVRLLRRPDGPARGSRPEEVRRGKPRAACHSARGGGPGGARPAAAPRGAGPGGAAPAVAA